jgi:glycosyltransferase involved in cell wall biosynthesis
MLSSLCETVTLLPAPRWPLGPLARLRRALRAPADVVIPRRSPALAEVLQRLVAQHSIDLVHLEELGWEGYAHTLRGMPTVLVKQNVEAQMWASLTAGKDIATPGWALTALEARALRRWEGRAAACFSRVVTVSESQCEALAALGCPRKRIAVVFNGVDTDYFAPVDVGQVDALPSARTLSYKLAFIGALFWYPNADTACWMASEIWPHVRAQEPAAKLFLVGQEPTAPVRALAAMPGVTVTGTVPDVRPYLADAAVVVVPTRVSGGTRLKVLEALAMGKAVVSTSVGAEGLDLVPGRELVVADGAVAFADAVVALLRDPARRAELGAAGRAAVVARYDWQVILPALEDVYREVVGP